MVILLHSYFVFLRGFGFLPSLPCKRKEGRFILQKNSMLLNNLEVSTKKKGQRGTQSCLGFGVCVCDCSLAGDLKMHFERLEKRWISKSNVAAPLLPPPLLPLLLAQLSQGQAKKQGALHQWELSQMDHTTTTY